MTVDRFVLVAGQTGSRPADFAASNSLTATVELKGASVFANCTDRLLALPGGSGFLFGRVFPRHAQQRQLGRDNAVALSEIASSPIEVMRDRYWGAYVLCFETAGRTTIVRDPMGGMPVYFTKQGRSLFLSSDVGLLIGVSTATPSIDWSEIPRYLANKDFPTARSGLEGIRELLAGMAVDLDHRTSSMTFRETWSPWDHADLLIDKRPEELADRLRRAIENSMSAWASCYRRSVVPVSGGLDSSIVLHELSANEVQCSALTLFTEDPDGDERPFARIIAEHAGVELSAIDYDTRRMDFGRSVVGHLPKPCGRIHDQFLCDTLVAAVEANGADAVMSGNGGDNIFYNSRSVRPFFDRLRHEGWTSGLRETLSDIASVTKESEAVVAWHALKLMPKLLSAYRPPTDESFLSRDARRACRGFAFSHHWLAPTRRPSLGKLGHVALLLRMQNHTEGYLRRDDIPVINPLASQPIVETALAIPTWRMIGGGRDRAVVRTAVGRKLPAAILARRRKGSPGSFALGVIDRHLDQVRQRLLDGHLVHQGMLDRIELEAVLKKGPAMGPAFMRILALLDTEAWIETWRSR
jgi:asparagine synthase (glutamine-hydrolysing)